MSQETLDTIVILVGLLAASGFVIGLHYMNSPATARSGNRLSAAGMTLAVVVTFASLILREGGISTEGLVIIVGGFLIGGAVGLLLALRVAMTAMPQLVSLFNAVGGGAAAIVALFDYGHVVGTPEEEVSTTIFVVLGVVIGSVTFSGSLIASGKLQGLISGKPIKVPGRHADDGHPRHRRARGHRAPRAQRRRVAGHRARQRGQDRSRSSSSSRSP